MRKTKKDNYASIIIIIQLLVKIVLVELIFGGRKDS